MINCRFVSVTTLVALLLGLAACQAKAAEVAKPNILFLFADDWAWPHASCLGAPQVRTPTFDRLVQEGVLFRNAHCAAPSCSPSRAAVLTGQWHWRLEEGANLRGALAAKFTVYPDLLEQAGYFIGLTGKGYGPGSIADRPRNPAGPAFKDFEAFLAARPKDKPFCFWFGSHHPHRPYRWQEGRRNGFDPAKVVVPPYLPDSEAVRDDIADYFAEIEAFDRESGSILAALEKTGELDRTLIVISGDNGWPFPRCKAGVYDSGTHQPLAVRWAGKVRAGRVVEDFVSLADLAPTFLEAAGLSIPATMTAKSLLPLLLSEKSGQVEPQRDHVLTGMETHVACHALPDGSEGGYPMRSIITHDFHFIRNFRPDRWAAGDPAHSEMPSYELLAKDTQVGWADCDASPSKAWMLTHRDEPATAPFVARAFGKRPARELYDLRKDPYEMTNVAEDAAYANTVQQLEKQLLAELKATADPRASGGGDEFDRHNAPRQTPAKSKNNR
jgi:N-sulfoglucosamine sulfohydrolase